MSELAPVAHDDALRQYPVFPCYRSTQQRDLVTAMLAPDGPREILGVLPTGGGKSFTFLLPTLARTDGGTSPGLTLVVSPIIALMNDQVAQVRRRYVSKYPSFRVEQLNSTLSTDERREVLRALRAGAVHLLYLSPETLVQPWFLHTLLEASAPLRFLVIDEAHMIREWGEDFRCDFQRLGALREELVAHAPGLRTLLLSATLTADTRAAVLAAMRIDPKGCRVIERAALRPELHYEVRHFRRGEDKGALLLDYVRALPRPGIIYCTRKAACDEVYALLERGGMRAMRVYNGDTPLDSRREILREFQAGLTDLVIATNAFGLGVDKGNVRYVLHYQVPDSLDRYYQEVGRAGRDGQPARALLFFCGSDLGAMRRQAVARLETAKIVDRFLKMWSARARLSSFQGRTGSFALLNDLLVPDYNLARQGVGAPPEQDGYTPFWNNVALNFLERAGLLRLVGTALRKIVGRPGPRAPVEATARVVWEQLRAGEVDLVHVVRVTGTDLRELERMIFRLAREGSIEIDTTLSGAVVEPLPDLDDRLLEDALTASVDAHRTREKVQESAAIEHMAALVRDQGCRERHFADLYGYPASEPGCGRCDQCLWAGVDGQPLAPALDVEREMTMEQAIRGQVDQLLGWYNERGRRALEGNIAEALLEELDRQCNNLRERADGSPRVEVAFLGATTVGKSTLINALLGERLLPMMVVGSTTAAQVVLRYGPVRRVTVHYKDHETIQRCLTRLRADWDRAREAELSGEMGPDEEDLQRLKSIARNLYDFDPNHVLERDEIAGPLDPDLLARLGTEREIAEDFSKTVWDHIAGRYWAIVRKVVVELPHRLLAGGLEIVDLPGTGDIDEGHLEPTKEFIAGADQFVLVLGPDCITSPVKQMLVEYELLVSMLQKQREPMVILGTRLDLSNEARPELLTKFGLDASLSGLPAIGALWQKKAEAMLRELMRPLAAQRLPRLPGETDGDFTTRVNELLDGRFGLSRAVFQPTNPRAALELNPETAPKKLTEIEIAAWKERYPTFEATGIPAAREALSQVAEARREAYWTSVRADAFRLHKIFLEKIDYAKSIRGATDTESALEQLRDIRTAAIAHLSTIREAFAERINEWRATFAGRAEATRTRVGESGAEHVKQHLYKKNAQKIRAACREPRNGFYAPDINVPGAIFGNFSQELANGWGSDLGGDLRRMVGELRGWQADVSSRLNQVLVALDPESARAVAPSVDSARDVLDGTLKRTGEVVDVVHERVGRVFPHNVVPEAQRSLGPFCKQGLLLSGTGVTQHRITILADCAAHVGDVVTQEIRRQSLEALNILEETLRQDVFIVIEAGAKGVFDELERLLEQLGAGTGSSAVGGARSRLEEALARLPVWTLGPDEPSP